MVSASAGKWQQISYTSFNLPDATGGILARNGTRYTFTYDEDHKRFVERRTTATGTRTTFSLHPDAANGLSFEQEVAENGSISNRHYISAGGMAIAVVTTNGAIGSATQATIVATQYWHKDHLGSTIAATDATGAVIGRYSYDPFGKRRNISGSYDAMGNLVIDWGLTGAGAGPDRGFTGHEHLDDLGIIHMNGRLYDPHIARMMQADPIIAGLVDAQYFNRYSYVFNRPTSLTDATGECPICFWVIGTALFARAVGIIDTKTLRAIVGIAVVPLLGPQGAWAVFGQGYALANVAIAGFVSGTISSGSLKGGLQGAFSAMLTYGVGTLAEGLAAAPGGGGLGLWGEGGIGHALLHAGAGCINATLSGGNCGRGAATAGISAFLSGNLPGAGMKNPGLGTLRAAIIGGTVSVIGGGKFANGARTAAFQYLFNQLAHSGTSHRYQHGPTWMCDMDQAGCTMSATLDVVDKRSLGILAGSPVEGRNVLPPFGDLIEHVVDRENFKIYNITVEGQHQFHPGQVVHSLSIETRSRWSWSEFTFQSVDAIYLTTIGTGLGANPNWNNAVGRTIFGFTHWTSQYEMQRRARKGSQ